MQFLTKLIDFIFHVLFSRLDIAFSLAIININIPSSLQLSLSSLLPNLREQLHLSEPHPDLVRKEVYT